MRTTIIAEVGLTHDGSLGNALRMVEVFAAAGADAIKFQDHRGQEVTGEHPSPHVHEPRGRYYERTAFADHCFGWRAIRQACRDAGVEYIVSPFSVEAVQAQESHEPDRWKVASGEVTNLPLLRAIRDTGRPVLLSSGMSSDQAMSDAVRLFWTTAENGVSRPCDYRLVALECQSLYPAPPEAFSVHRWWPEDDDLYAGGPWWPVWGRRVPWGLSDHSPPDSIAACLAAVTLGATVLERHVTLSRDLYGSDAWMSMEPEDFARLVREVRALEEMLASTTTKDELVATPEIQATREVFLNVAE